MSKDVPKSSLGAMVQAIVSILSGVAILAMAAYGWVAPWIEHRDWVAVSVRYENYDCRTSTCVGSKGSRYSCQECDRKYRYEYNGRKISGVEYNKSPSNGEPVKAYINPKNPGKPFRSPSVGLFILVIFLSIFAFAFAAVYIGIYKSYKALEKAGRKDLIQKIADGEDITDADINKYGPPKTKYGSSAKNS